MLFAGFREQLNELTHCKDGSALYSSTQAQLEELLDPTMNGKLRQQMNKKQIIDYIRFKTFERLYKSQYVSDCSSHYIFRHLH